MPRLAGSSANKDSAARVVLVSQRCPPSAALKDASSASSHTTALPHRSPLERQSTYQTLRNNLELLHHKTPAAAPVPADPHDRLKLIITDVLNEDKSVAQMRPSRAQMIPRSHAGDLYVSHEQQQQQVATHNVAVRKINDNVSREDVRYMHHPGAMARPDMTSAADRHSAVEMMRHEDRRKFMRTVNDCRTPADEAMARDALLRMSDNILMRDSNHPLRGDSVSGAHHPPAPHPASSMHRRDEVRNVAMYNEERLRDMAAASGGNGGLYHHPHHPPHESDDLHHHSSSRHHTPQHLAPQQHVYHSRGGLEERAAAVLAAEGGMRGGVEELIARDMMLREERGRELRPEDRLYVGDARVSGGQLQPDYTQVSLMQFSYFNINTMDTGLNTLNFAYLDTSIQHFIVLVNGVCKLFCTKLFVHLT